MTSSLWSYSHIFENDVIFEMALERIKVCTHMFVFWHWIKKCLNQVSYVTKTTYDVILVKYLVKNGQILESDFGKPKKLVNFR